MPTCLQSRLTYANVMATIAVFLALGGGAYAAFGVPKNSVGTKQLKNGAVTTGKLHNGAVTGAKVANGTLSGAQINVSTLGTVPNATTAANAQALGGVPASGYQGRIAWAHIAADGTIISQSGGISVSVTPVNGAYYLNFGETTTGKALTVSMSDVNLAFAGTPLAAPCGGGTGAVTCIPTGTNDANHVFVFTSNPSNTSGSNHAFYITLTP